MKHYETVAGHVTRGTTYAQINEKLIEVEELCQIMGHLHQTEDTAQDRLLATGWRGVAELLKRMRFQVTELAMKRMN